MYYFVSQKKHQSLLVWSCYIQIISNIFPLSSSSFPLMKSHVYSLTSATFILCLSSTTIPSLYHYTLLFLCILYCKGRIFSSHSPHVGILPLPSSSCKQKTDTIFFNPCHHSSVLTSLPPYLQYKQNACQVTYSLSSFPSWQQEAPR